MALLQIKDTSGEGKTEKQTQHVVILMTLSWEFFWSVSTRACELSAATVYLGIYLETDENRRRPAEMREMDATGSPPTAPSNIKFTAAKH